MATSNVSMAAIFGNTSPPAGGRQTVALGYGKAVLKDILATYAAMKVSAPFSRVTAITSGVKMGANTTTRVGNWDGNGVLISANVGHENGSVILLQAKWMNGARLLREGGLFLRLRAGAPLYNVIAYVPTGPENICGDQFQVFSGHADILNADELKLLGLEVPRGYISRYMDREELAECFRLVQSAPESTPRPAIGAIATPTGIEMREIAQAPKRRMIVRRK